jgi:hypothetical protein
VKLIKGYKSWVSQQEFRGAIVIKSASASPLLIGQIPFHFLIRPVEKKLPVTGVSAVVLVSLFWFESNDSNGWSVCI